MKTLNRGGMIGLALLLAGCAQNLALKKDNGSGAVITRSLVDKGNAAAQQQNWPQAVAYYSQAQEQAHLSPQIMFNLAAAHAQAGNELLADVWFRAYLAAVPDAANAEQVNVEIARLEQATKARMERLFQQAEQLAEQLPLKGESANSFGRREEAFKGIALIRFKVGDFKGGDEDVRKSKQVAVGNWSGGYLEDEWRNRDFAEALAAVGDIEGAKAVYEQMKDDNLRPDVERSIQEAVVRSASLSEMKELLDKKTFPANLSMDYDQLALKFAEKGDLATAETIAGKRNDWGYVSLSEWLLSKGRISDAVRIARLAKDNPLAMAIRGEVENALRDIKAGKDTSMWDPSSDFYDLNHIIMDSIYLGDIRTAQRANKLADEIARTKWDGAHFKRYAMGKTQPGKACLDVENGKVDEAIQRIDRGALVVNEGQNLKGERIIGTMAEYEARRFQWMCDICDFAISRGKLEAAEKLADSFRQSRKRIEFMHQILGAYQAKGDHSNADRLGQKLASVMAEARWGWTQGTPGREIAVNAWLDAAAALNREPAVRDIQAFLAKQRSNSPEYTPNSVADAASKFGLGLIRIRAVAKSIDKAAEAPNQ